MKINTFLIKAIKDMISLDTIRLALYTGVPLAFIWLGIGWLLWDWAIALTSYAISWLPFSVVRANGAFIIIFFIWFSAVLISYALFIGLFSGFILGNKKESQFEAINFSIIFILSILWAIIIFLNWDFLDQKIQYYLTILPFQTVADAIAALLAVYIFYNLFLISEYFVVFIFREPFIQALLEKHYPDVEIKKDFSSLKAYNRLYLDIAIFLIASFLAIPLLFIPVANFLVIWFLWAWLYKESAFLGVCSIICTEEDYARLKEHKGYMMVASLLAALLNFIPIISFFTPFFVMTLYFHWIMEEKINTAKGY